VGSVINGDFMKILVTGGTGTVGKEVVKALLRSESDIGARDYAKGSPFDQS